MSPDQHKETDQAYTGINRLLKSQAIQALIDQRNNGTFSEFFDDWRWIFSYSKKYRWIIAFYTLLGVAGTTLSLASSVISKYLIDIIVDRRLEQLWLLAIAMLLSTISSLIFTNLVSRFSAKLTVYVNNDIQADIFERILDADWSDLTAFPNGDLLNRFNSDVGTVANNAISWIPNLVIALYQFVATFVVILHYDLTMAFIALLSAPFLLFASRIVLRKNKEYRERLLKINSGLMSFEAETFYNIDTIKSFGIMQHYGRKLTHWQEQYKTYALDYNAFTIKMNIGMTLLNSFIGLLAFGYCLLRLWTGAITFGTMTLFLQQRTQLSGNFNTLVGIIPGMLNSSVSAHRIRELIELPRETHFESNIHSVNTTDGYCVQMEGVDFGYKGTAQVFSQSDFIANPGEIVAIVGPSGEGKTTMLRLFLGLVQPQAGTVTLSTAEGIKFPVNADTRELFSYVPQGNTLLSGSVRDNLCLSKEDATDDEVIDALKAACAWDFVSKMDGGLHGKVGERGRGLSEGQAQRLAIARALLRNAPILLMDEATSALDVETERQVLRNIMNRHPNKVCIVTTHRPSVLELCQRVYRVSGHTLSELDEKAAEKLVKDF